IILFTDHHHRRGPLSRHSGSELPQTREQIKRDVSLTRLRSLRSAELSSEIAVNRSSVRLPTSHRAGDGPCSNDIAQSFHQLNLKPHDYRLWRRKQAEWVHRRTISSLFCHHHSYNPLLFIIHGAT
ncbi:hypothetical protein WG66_004452, partial [Moniliophthora roreri]